MVAQSSLAASPALLHSRSPPVFPRGTSFPASCTCQLCIYLGDPPNTPLRWELFCQDLKEPSDYRKDLALHVTELCEWTPTARADAGVSDSMVICKFLHKYSMRPLAAAQN